MATGALEGDARGSARLVGRGAVPVYRAASRPSRPRRAMRGGPRRRGAAVDREIALHSGVRGARLCPVRPFGLRARHPRRAVAILAAPRRGTVAPSRLYRYGISRHTPGGYRKMAFDPWQTSTAYDRAQGAEATFIAKVYRWMAAGLAITGLFALGVVQSAGLRQIIFGNRIVFYGLIIGELV